MQFTRPILAGILAAVALLSASTVPGAAAERAPSPARTQVTLATATTDFGFRLLDALSTTGQPNVFISPVSAELALAMAYNGAGGSTRAAMQRALALPGQSPHAASKQAAGLLRALASSDPKAQLEVANSLWARAGISFKQRFLHDATHDFAAKVASLDFNSPSAPATINRWVSGATHGAIPSIVDRIPTDTFLYLIDAVYFNAQWTSQFNPARTHKAAFTTAPGQQVQVPLMDQTGGFPYYSTPTFQLISLPYGSGRFAMTVLLPKPGTTLQTLRSQLTPAIWANWLSHQQLLHGDIALPRFSVTNTFALKGALARLGMGVAFSRTADFRGMCLQPCKLTSARQKTYLKVYEKGTVAAGVTSIGVGPTAIEASQFQMVVDHPFLLAIRDTRTGTLLFLGEIGNPEG